MRGTSQLVFSGHQNREVGSGTSEGRARAARQKAIASFSHVLYIGCQQDVWPRLKVDLSTSNDLIKNSSQV